MPFLWQSSRHWNFRLRALLSHSVTRELLKLATAFRLLVRCPLRSSEDERIGWRPLARDARWTQRSWTQLATFKKQLRSQLPLANRSAFNRAVFSRVARASVSYSVTAARPSCARSSFLKLFSARCRA